MFKVVFSRLEKAIKLKKKKEVVNILVFNFFVIHRLQFKGEKLRKEQEEVYWEYQRQGMEFITWNRVVRADLIDSWHLNKDLSCNVFEAEETSSGKVPKYSFASLFEGQHEGNCGWNRMRYGSWTDLVGCCKNFCFYCEIGSSWKILSRRVIDIF